VDQRGVFRIIDRKKDIIKLQFGEYIPLGRVETVLKANPLVDDVCVYGDMFQNHLVALIQPNERLLRTLADKCGLKPDVALDQLCSDKKLVTEVHKQLVELAKQPTSGPLVGRQIPSAIHLCPQNWVTAGLMTAALKIRRKAICDFYRVQIDAMYQTLK
jgi:long-chain acyl-CoA synthetase